MDNLKNLSCEELDKERQRYLKLIFDRDTTGELKSLLISRLTKIEIEIENRIEAINDIMKNSKDLVIVEYDIDSLFPSYNNYNMDFENRNYLD